MLACNIGVFIQHEGRIDTKRKRSHYFCKKSSKMGIYEFNGLGEDEKRKVLKNQGIEIARRSCAEGEFILYSIDDFYIEVKWRMELVPEQIRTFVSTAPLDPYLHYIDISEL